MLAHMYLLVKIVSTILSKVLDANTVLGIDEEPVEVPGEDIQNSE